eukprot:gnl/TRDRNA2_/TRDRNA2_184994_c0_seq1.p1 gnl/TRDRNA2_/TRDRNA2_184994_c0~~gnl/TRDRNA2_/TRDRNA2_184994_c0_seq1.p1  ORF type:complete len:226 (+),score=30.49 gnl/TRDRNA2_/TRDRNA2_184994_c0_seq1:77-754(+)
MPGYAPVIGAGVASPRCDMSARVNAEAMAMAPASLSHVYTGGIPQDPADGIRAKKAGIAARSGPLSELSSVREGLQGVDRSDRGGHEFTGDAGTGWSGREKLVHRCERARINVGKRSYQNTRMVLSTVDKIISESEEIPEQPPFNEQYQILFDGAAGVKPGELDVRVRGVKSYPGNPTMQSQVDEIVFHSDQDLSGPDQFDGSFMKMFEGRAGQSTIPLKPSQRT